MAGITRVSGPALSASRSSSSQYSLTATWYAARLDVLDQLAVFGGVERVIGAAGQRRHGHDSGGELAIEDGRSFHGTSRQYRRIDAKVAPRSQCCQTTFEMHQDQGFHGQLSVR
jgi:hypothetical protein